MTRTAAVYRAYDADDQLLYVGQSRDPKRRIAHHLGHKTWAPLVARWTVTDPMPVGDALDAESEAILRERPVYNVAGTSRWASWERNASKRHLAVLTAIGEPMGVEILNTFMTSEPLRPLDERLRSAIDAARAADPSITTDEVRWALDNWYGPLGGIRTGISVA